MTWNMTAGTLLKGSQLTGNQAPLSRGYAAFSIAGSGNYSPTATQQEAENWELTGVLTGNKTVTVPPAASGFAYPLNVFNNTSGAFSVTVLVSGQTGIVVGQGKRAVLLVDATDVRRLAADV